MKKIIILTVILIIVSSFKHVKQLEISDSLPFSKKRVIENNAFTYGEELNYRVHYGIINAAKIKMRVEDKPVEINGRQTFHLIADGKTNKTFDWMFKVRDRFESYLDMEFYAPIKYFKSVKEDRYSDVDLVFFDHENKWLKGKKKSMECPAYVQDIIGATYYARTIDFNKAQKGDVFPINIYLDQEIYNLEFKYLGKETIKSDIGKVRCIKIMPKVVKDRVFKDDDAITLWISDDDNKIPVRVEAEIYVGSVKVDLTSYSGLRNNFSSKK
ncbi:MAG: DUF3108 domain-containing protein [Bacteroidetes bacterium]|nr:DUF3108 domain-containing protein [Bacteroidota bacterium]